ncbi:MAG: TolC family protein [Chitinophagaceae bacterium]|nr:TolC family protein [Chitinophagaceae bacterium]
MKLRYRFLLFFSSVFCFFSASAQREVLTIQEAVKAAIENNFDVRIADNTTQISVINNDWGIAGALPQVNAFVNQNFGTNNLKQKLNTGTIIEKKGNNSQSISAGLQVVWRVFDGMKMFATKRKLEELQEMGELAFRKTLNETVYNVIASYYSIVTLKEQIQATEEQIKLYEDRWNLSKAKYEIGTGAKYEVLEAEVDMNSQESNLLSLRNALAIAKSSLYNLMGRTADTSYTIIDTIVVNAIPTLPEIQEKIELYNPDILLANSNLNVLFETKNEVKANKLPSVTLTGNYNFNKNSSSAGFNLFNQTYGLSGLIGISIPIFQGRVVNKQMQVADINIRNQQLAIEKAKNDIRTAVNNAVINYSNARKIIELETGNLKTAKENIDIATERYKRLNITTVELRQIQISYNATKTRLVNAMNQAKMAEAMIALLTGDIGNL